MENQDFQSMPADLMRSYRERLKHEIGFVCHSRQMKQLRTEAELIARKLEPITIIGPSGTGRKTLAKTVHFSGANWWRPFVDVDLSHSEIEEAERNLFGHYEGHIFSSDEYKPGLISESEQSTICFQNFSHYAKPLQRKIIEIVKRRRYVPPGGRDEQSVDCRFVFTLHHDPDELLKVGQIEETVYPILTEKVLNVPPLAKRRDDIVPLAEKFIQDCSAEFKFVPKQLSKDAERWLKRAPWNRNIPQLKRSIYLASLNTTDPVLTPEHFALAHDGNIDRYQNKQLEELSIQSLIETKLESFLGRLGEYEATHLYEAIMDRVEEPLLKLVLDHSNGNQIRASRMLGVNRNTLRTKLRKYSIKPTRSGKGK